MDLRRLHPYFAKIPSVEKPKRGLTFREKFGWTVGISILYFILTNIPVFGLSPDSIDIFAQYRAFFAGAAGSLLALGIGPIVTASIVLQLLVGAGIIKLDLTKPEDRAFYQDLQRFLVLVMIVLQAAPQIIGGFLKPNVELANKLGIPVDLLSFLIFIQLCIGGLLIVYMDEVVSKWGIGSGVSLFILASISQALIVGLFNWVSPEGGMPPGIVPRLYYIFTNYPLDYLLSLDGIVFLLVDGGILAFITTVLIILLVVLAEGTRVEIPLAHSLVRGARGRFPIKLIYASVLPMIFVRALQANIVILGLILYQNGITVLGEYAPGSAQPISGLMYLVSPINGPYDWVPALVKDPARNPYAPYFADLPDWMIILHLFVDATILIVGGILFAKFWVETAGMDAKTVAMQIARSGLIIPGFRKNPKILEKLLNRYIPKVTVLGGAIVGLLTFIASMLGTIGNVGGTGLLLAVSIAYRFYEDIRREQITEMHPMIRRLLGEER